MSLLLRKADRFTLPEEDDEHVPLQLDLYKKRQSLAVSQIYYNVVQLQEVLQFSPFKGKPSKSMHYEVEPVVAGYVLMQKQNFTGDKSNTWRRIYMEVIDSVMFVRNSPSGHNQIAERICFVSCDNIDPSVLKGHASQELYLSYLEKDSEKFQFRIYTPRKIFFFAAPSQENREEFTGKICQYLQSVFDEALWSQKLKAAEQLEPLLKEQYVVDIQRQDALLQALVENGMMGEISVLSAVDKKMSGVLKMFQHVDLFADNDDVKSPGVEEKWAEYYFVLHKGALYYFRSSKDPVPTGFVSLDLASIDLDHDALTRKEYTFTITTPLRSLTLQCKHDVSLSLWLAALNRVIGSEDPESPRRNSADILLDIRNLEMPISDFSTLVKNPDGLKYFQEYLISVNALDELECMKQLRLVVGLPAGSDRETAVENLRRTYFDRMAPHRINGIPFDVAAIFDKPAPAETTLDELKSIWEFLANLLKGRFSDFKGSSYCQNFMRKWHGSEEKASIPEFNVGDDVLALSIRVKGDLKAKIHRLDMVKHHCTIGRDVSCDIVIDDDRVSRNHGRFEFDDHSCRYKDLGSSHGSKFKGEKVTDVALQVGDEIKVGKTKIQLILTQPKTSLLQKIGL